MRKASARILFLWEFRIHSSRYSREEIQATYIRCPNKILTIQMRQFLLCVSILLLSLFSTQAQSKRAVRAYNEARQEIRANNYQDALEELEDALEDSPDYLDALLLKADIHKKMGDDEKALPLYEKALQSGAPYYVNLFYGQALFLTGNYEEAIPPLERYLQSPQASSRYVGEVQQLIASAKFAAKATTEPKDYNPQNLGNKVNSRDMEYFPSISADGNTLVFTHRAMEGEDSDEDFWVTNRDTASGEWQKAEPLRGFLNTELNEGAQSLNSSGNIIFFAACERPEGVGSCDIYASFYRGKGIWSKPMNLGSKINTAIWESQPSISSDGRTLYFVRGKSSYDKNIDIMYSTLGDDGRWSEAKPIEGKVNTPKQETSPFIHFDDQSLYFSSNGHPGMGDLDFFVSRRQPDGSWGEPQNLGYPINTPSQEFSLIVAPDGKTGFFASDALEGGYGLLDLYSFELPEESQAAPVAYIRGRVSNKKTGEPISASIEFTDLDSNHIVRQKMSDKNGQFYAVLPASTDYALSIQKPGFLFYSKNFRLGTQTEEEALMLDIKLIPIEVGKKIKLENIFFAYDSYELEERSLPELETVKEFMEENQGVKISIEGHTDSQGNAAYNKELSNNRAKAVYDRLLEMGVAAERMTYKGFGATEPVATNDTEEGRAMNRRTELKITDK